MKKIDLIIDALSVAQNSVWSALNQEALAYAIELKLELAEPVAWMMPDYGDVLSASEADGTGIYNIPLYTAPPKREWVGLSVNEARDFFESKLCREDLITEISGFLEEKNT